MFSHRSKTTSIYIDSPDTTAAPFSYATRIAGICDTVVRLRIESVCFPLSTNALTNALGCGTITYSNLTDKLSGVDREIEVRR